MGSQAQRGLSPSFNPNPLFPERETDTQRGAATPLKTHHRPAHPFLREVRIMKPVSGCVRRTGCRNADAQLTGTQFPLQLPLW